VNSSDYQPVSCGQHSEYELLAMRRTPVTLQYLDDAGVERHFQGRVTDVFTRAGAEYMALEAKERVLMVRLDRIRRLRRR